MTKAITFRNTALLPSYGLEEVQLDLGLKIANSLPSLKSPLEKSLLGQVILLLSSNPNKTTANAMRGGEAR